MTPDDPQPPPPLVPAPPVEDVMSKPWWEHSAFRSAIVTIYSIWLPFLHAWITRAWTEAGAYAVGATITAILSAFGLNVITRQNEVRAVRISKAMSARR